MPHQSVLHYWFETLTPADWFRKSAELDRDIADRFGDLHAAALAAELYHWRNSAGGRLAEIIVLDQFSRNLYRDSARAFAADAQALVLAQEALRQGAEAELSPTQRSFLYMPFMHSESLLIQRESLLLYEALGIANNYQFAIKHYDIIRDFGRFPHRNALLGRDSSAAERAFLQQPGSAF